MANSNRKSNHNADISNANPKTSKGTSGINPTYKAALDNRSDQLNPNNSKFQGKK